MPQSWSCSSRYARLDGACPGVSSAIRFPARAAHPRTALDSYSGSSPECCDPYSSRRLSDVPLRNKGRQLKGSIEPGISSSSFPLAQLACNSNAEREAEYSLEDARNAGCQPCNFDTRQARHGQTQAIRHCLLAVTRCHVLFPQTKIVAVLSAFICGQQWFVVPIPTSPPVSGFLRFRTFSITPHRPPDAAPATKHRFLAITVITCSFHVRSCLICVHLRPNSRAHRISRQTLRRSSAFREDERA